MNDHEILQWWQNRYPQWASVTAPLVRYFVHDVVQSVPLETILRLSFVRALWRDESIRMSNASSRLCNIYDCSAVTIIDDLKRIGTLPLAHFVQRYPTQSQVSQATFSLFTAPSQAVIQDVGEFDACLSEFCQTHQTGIIEAIAAVETSCPRLVLDDTAQLTAKKEDDLCFQWTYYLAIADALEPERRKLVRFVKFGEEPPKIVAEKCRQFFARFKELLEYTRKNKPPYVMQTWLDEVESWVQRSKLAFPDYQSAAQARAAKRKQASALFEQLLDESSRQRLASIGEFTLRDDRRFSLAVTYKKLKELESGWAPMSLQVIFDRKAKDLRFTEQDKTVVLEVLQQFTADIMALQSLAIEYARDMNFELMRNGKWIPTQELADDQLVRSVKKLTIQVFCPQPSIEEEVIATLELDCDWDLEHGVRFGMLANHQIILQP
jgi:hypothetical protein